jgi:hypothetical protein
VGDPLICASKYTAADCADPLTGESVGEACPTLCGKCLPLLCNGVSDATLCPIKYGTEDCTDPIVGGSVREACPALCGVCLDTKTTATAPDTMAEGEDDNKKDAEGKDDDSDTATMMWGLIGAVVGVGACGILTYLYVNGCSGKADGGTGAGKDEAVKEFSLKLSNAVYTRGSTDGELYGTAGPNSAGAGQGDGGQNYAEIGLIEGGAYANVVDGDDGGYMLTSATGTPSGKGVYDVDFAAPTSTVGLALLGVFLSCVVLRGGAYLSGNGGPAVNTPCCRGTHLPLVPTT